MFLLEALRTHFPERGWKLQFAPYLKQRLQLYEHTSPKGDGNSTHAERYRFETLRTHFPERGWKQDIFLLVDRTLLHLYEHTSPKGDGNSNTKPSGCAPCSRALRTHFPERGWKPIHFPKRGTSPKGDGNPYTSPKGDENFFVIHKRGRKLFSWSIRRKSFTNFPKTSPKGDGNTLSFLSKPGWVGSFPNTLPRKGTETLHRTTVITIHSINNWLPIASQNPVFKNWQAVSRHSIGLTDTSIIVVTKT